jgi:hypothetical protein
LNITSNSRGENANTVSPVLIKSDGTIVSTSEWQKHLRGEKFTAYAGDHITPCVNNPILMASANGVVRSEVGTAFSVNDEAWLWNPIVSGSLNTATATATVTVTTYGDVDAGDTIVLIDAYGNSHTFTEGSQAPASATFDSVTSNNQTATNIAATINHNSQFSASASSAVVTITQALIGATGNTTVTLNNVGDVGWSKTNFTGGITIGMKNSFYEPFTIYDKDGNWCSVKPYSTAVLSNHSFSQIENGDSFGGHTDGGGRVNLGELFHYGLEREVGYSLVIGWLATLTVSH